MKGFFHQIVLRSVIMNHIKSPSDNFRTIIAKGSWFLISSIKTFQPQSNSEALINIQPSSVYFQQNSICLNEEDKNSATKEKNTKFHLVNAQDVIDILYRHRTRMEATH